jgi:phospholipase D
LRSINKLNSFLFLCNLTRKNLTIFSVAITFFIIGFSVCEFSKKPSDHFHSALSTKTLYQTCFTPNQRCLPLILETINQAKTSIKLQAYSFTSKEIASALIKAHQRRVKVTVIADKSQKNAPYSQVKELTNNGIEVFFDVQPAIAHNKVIIIDTDLIITGSYNFSQAAEYRNAENILIIRNYEIAQNYQDNFNRRLALSVKAF